MTTPIILNHNEQLVLDHLNSLPQAATAPEIAGTLWGDRSDQSAIRVVRNAFRRLVREGIVTIVSRGEYAVTDSKAHKAGPRPAPKKKDLAKKKAAAKKKQASLQKKAQTRKKAASKKPTKKTVSKKAPPPPPKPSSSKMLAFGDGADSLDLADVSVSLLGEDSQDHRVVSGLAVFGPSAAKVSTAAAVTRGYVQRRIKKIGKDKIAEVHEQGSVSQDTLREWAAVIAPAG